MNSKDCHFDVPYCAYLQACVSLYSPNMCNVVVQIVLQETEYCTKQQWQLCMAAQSGPFR